MVQHALKTCRAGFDGSACTEDWAGLGGSDCTEDWAGLGGSACTEDM